ncbi:DUF1801 domain-containing protein [Aestuariivivens sediminis]|uniref:DUF1801 domain-containing protein n=1 Tax=Aestuariivivens sediminis TaxID=2913557 RepID=UPI001F585215
MKYEASTPEEYIDKIPEDRREAMRKLRKVILKNLPKGFEEGINYNMIGYFVPHSVYPKGYHCNPKLPLPFLNIASQKNGITLYHMALYARADLRSWFVNTYKKMASHNVDMGKGCIRFKKVEAIPLDLIGELVRKISVEEWVSYYEMSIKK